jgi:hypothetical protein
MNGAGLHLSGHRSSREPSMLGQMFESSPAPPSITVPMRVDNLAATSRPRRHYDGDDN